MQASGYPEGLLFSLIKSQYGGRGERRGEALQGAREEAERGRRQRCQDRQTSAAR